MAIKRQSKSRVTPVSQPVPAEPVRPIDVKPQHQMVAGDLSQGWLCKNRACGLVIAIEPPPAGGKTASDADDPLTAIKCPHCGNEDLYRWSARGEHPYTPKGAGA